MKRRLLCAGLLLFTVVVSLLPPETAARAGPSFQTSEVQAILDTMTPEERVGQLFLVTFQGTDTHDQTQIYDLIANYHVGGVVLLAGNDNFMPQPDTLSSTHQLTTGLQRIEANATAASEADASVNDKAYVPLFIGISQEGDGEPQDQILSGLTPLPNSMALGATWDTELAQEVGAVAGSELSALGFNLFLGPSLDVAETPNPDARSDLGPRVFGGDPFWVGEMGRAYISGLHNGSNFRMMVVAKHFPGRGDSDRSPEEEVPTVRKSLEQLKQVELTPFFSITNAADVSGLVDGLLVSHIRYQGFQGNIRATTRPVSLDASALAAIISLEEFAAWRSNGGLIVSDALGSQAVRGFYAQTGESFLPRLVARDAFQAGNDLLYLGNITPENSEEDTYTATLGVLNFFAQEYRRDRAFAQLVDAAVARILAQKLRMYDNFEFAEVLAPQSGLQNINSSQDLIFEVARNAATLVSPEAEELNTRLPGPPNQGERITFLTDTSSFKQCTTCLWEDRLSVDTLQKEVLRLYGSSGSGQVFTSRLNSFPFSELELMLNGETTTDIEGVLERADWLVISLSHVGEGQISLLRRFFSERPNLIRNRNVILFAFTAPYYLDPTDISNLTAYYALYSKQPPFVEVAARLLFQQIGAQGTAPISIPAVGYDLIYETSPDEDQFIPLALDQGVEAIPTAETQTPALTEVVPTPTPAPLFRIGDTIRVRAGPIYDHNGHLVPDETPVNFIMTTRDETGEIVQEFEGTTTTGIARASFAIDRPGDVAIRAISEPALISGEIQFHASNIAAPVTVVVPTNTPTLAPPPTPIIIITPVQENDLVTPEGHPKLGSWILVMLAVVGGALLVFWAASRLVSPRWGLRWALCVFLGGLASYNYLALGFPGAAEWIATSAGAFGVLVLTFAGEVVGAVGAWLWMQLVSAQGSPGD